MSDDDDSDNVKFFQDDYKSASKLECFQQDDKFTLSDGGSGGVADLNTSVDAVLNMPFDDALRELTQNFFDGCTEQYGRNYLGYRNPSIDGMLMTVGESTFRGEHHSGCIMHNEDTAFGKIILVENHRTPKKLPFAADVSHTRSPPSPCGSLTFINYGVTLASMDLLLCYGVSGKRDYENQVGEHGEGFCRAVTRLLKDNIGVAVHCVIEAGDEGYIGENWTFCLDQRNRVKCKRVLRKGEEAGDTAKLEVILTWNTTEREPLAYSIYNYLAPIEHVRNPAITDEPGIIITDPKHRGEIYVWHFHVTGYEDRNMLWAYDFFMHGIARDRNLLDWQELVKLVAACLSARIEHDASFALLYFDVLMDESQATSHIVEKRAATQLTGVAKNILLSIYGGRYSPDAQPVTVQDGAMARQFTNTQLISPLLRDVITHEAVPITEVLVSALNMYQLREIPPAKMSPVWILLSELLKDVITIHCIGNMHDTFSIRYVFDGRHLYVAPVGVFKTDNHLAILSELLCYIIPQMYEKMTLSCDVTPFLTSIFHHHHQQQQHAPQQIIDIDQEEEEEEEVVLVHPPMQKRRKVEPPPELGEPPEGFKWVQTLVPTWGLAVI